MSSKKVMLDLTEYEPVIRLAIKDGGEFRIYPRGTSMLPMLRQEVDSVLLREPPGQCKKYDIILYRRSQGQYVLHRIVKVTQDGYVLCGDHQTSMETGISREQIIAIVDGFYRKEKRIHVKQFLYQCYVHIWCCIPLRKIGMKTGRILRQIWR